jgi:hypothetical protein
MKRQEPRPAGPWIVESNIDCQERIQLFAHQSILEGGIVTFRRIICKLLNLCNISHRIASHREDRSKNFHMSGVTFYLNINCHIRRLFVCNYHLVRCNSKTLRCHREVIPRSLLRYRVPSIDTRKTLNAKPFQDCLHCRALLVSFGSTVAAPFSWHSALVRRPWPLARKLHLCLAVWERTLRTRNLRQETLGLP